MRATPPIDDARKDQRKKSADARMRDRGYRPRDISQAARQVRLAAAGRQEAISPKAANKISFLVFPA